MYAVAHLRASVPNCVVTCIKASMHMYSKRVQTSASLIQLYNSSDTILPMLAWATYPSNHTATDMSCGHMISV